MSGSGQTDQELNDLIAEVTVDCHDEDEALSAFANAFDEQACYPLPGAVIGEDVEVLSVGLSNGRPELTATCKRAGRRHEVALLDVCIRADSPLSALLAAYRRWLGP